MHNDFLDDLDKVDLALYRYIQDNISILNAGTLSQLRDRYSCDKPSVLVHRGLNFSDKEGFDAFIDNMGDGKLSSHMATSWSPSHSTATGFARTKKTYGDMDMARESMAGLRSGEVISGYEGVVLTTEVSGVDVIDFSKCPFPAESEYLVMPDVSLDIKVEHLIPYKRRVEDIDDINKIILDEASEPGLVSFVIENFKDHISKESADKLIRDAKDEFKAEFDVSTDAATKVTKALDEGVRVGNFRFIEKESRFEKSFKIRDNNLNYMQFSESTGTRRSDNHKKLHVFLPCKLLQLFEIGIFDKDQANELQSEMNSIAVSVKEVCNHFGISELIGYNQDYFKLCCSDDVLKDLSGELLSNIPVSYQELNDDAMDSVTTKDDMYKFENKLTAALEVILGATDVAKGAELEIKENKNGRSVISPR